MCLIRRDVVDIGEATGGGVASARLADQVFGGGFGLENGVLGVDFCCTDVGYVKAARNVSVGYEILKFCPGK